MFPKRVEAQLQMLILAPLEDSKRLGEAIILLFAGSLWRDLQLSSSNVHPTSEASMKTYHVSSLAVPSGLYPTMTMSCCLQNSKSLGWVKYGWHSTYMNETEGAIKLNSDRYWIMSWHLFLHVWPTIISDELEIVGENVLRKWNLLPPRLIIQIQAILVVAGHPDLPRGKTVTGAVEIIDFSLCWPYQKECVPDQPKRNFETFDSLRSWPETKHFIFLNFSSF